MSGFIKILLEHVASDILKRHKSLEMDAKLIVQVIINLVENAIKYTPYGTSIRIVARKEEEAVAVSVIDNGPGIPKEIRPRVLTYFIQERTRLQTAAEAWDLVLPFANP